MDNITTIDGVIAEADRLEPNAWDRAEKVRCLSRLDGQLYDRYVRGRVGAPAQRPVYDDDTPGSTPLLCQHPYDGIYVHWLLAHIALYLGENDRYNDLMTAAEDARSVFAGAYAEEHPRNHRNRFRF